MAYSYLPFTEVKNTPAVIVDSFHPNGLVLSHWRGASTPQELREDTSAGMVLQAIKQKWPALEHYQYATANHFDIDGLVGIWALLNPELAMQHEETLRQMAVIGDFRELDLSAPFADKALKLVCWLNAEEKARFYPPFGSDELEESEVLASVPKFEFFLPAFTDVLLHTAKYEAVWMPEYEQVLKGVQQMQEEKTTLVQYPDLGLIVVNTPSPVHYYALFGPTVGYDIVLACYSDNRYELECKYTTWVDISSRPTLPRPNLKPLVQRLNTLEVSGYQWSVEGVTDTGPLLRLQGHTLRKAERYANPTERPIFSSSLPAKMVLEQVVSYLEEVFKDISPKKYWTWEEVKGSKTLKS